MTAKVIGQRFFAYGATRPVHEDERGQFIEEDGERIDGVWPVPEEDRADTLDEPLYRCFNVSTPRPRCQGPVF